MLLAICFALFCAAMLWVGWRSGRNIHHLRAFLLSNQNVNQCVLFTTIVASFVGGGVVIGTAEKAFQFGIGHAIALLGFALQLILTGVWIAPRMARFRNALSLGDVVAQYYGKVPQILSGLLWLSFSVGILTAQMSAMGNLLTSLLGFDRTICVLISASIVVLYCTMGGIRAVIATDYFQFYLLTIALLLVTFFGIYTVGGLETLLQSLPATHLTPTSHLSTEALILLFCSFLLGDALIPPVFQRLLLSKSPKVTKKAFFWGGVLIVPIAFLACSHGLIAYVLDPGMAKDQITVNLFHQTLATPFAIVAILGFFAVIMSSADTYLNAAAGSLVNDILIPLRQKKQFTDKQALRFAKLTTVILGGSAIYFAIAVQDIFDILIKTYEFWGPTMVVPLLAIMVNRTLPTYGFYACVIAGGLTVVLWNTLELESITHLSALIAGMLANAMVYIGLFAIKVGLVQRDIVEEKV